MEMVKKCASWRRDGDLMKGNVLFSLWEPFRQKLINGHIFYIEQARKRLLSSFNNIEEQAETAAKEFFDQHYLNVGSNFYEPEILYELSRDAGVEMYKLLCDMCVRTRLSVVAGIFHEWDKQLRNWLVEEIFHWCRCDKVKSKIWALDFYKIIDLLEGLGWKVRENEYFNKLDACRLVVNVYKHGEGKALNALRQHYPCYLNNPLNIIGDFSSCDNLLDYTDLVVSDAQLQEFSDAIIAFWKNAPSSIYNSPSIKLPDWFECAAFMKKN